MQKTSEVLKKIPTALTNLKIEKDQQMMVANYIFNLMLVILRDEELIEAINKDGVEKVVSDLVKV